MSGFLNKAKDAARDALNKDKAKRDAQSTGYDQTTTHQTHPAGDSYGGAHPNVGAGYGNTHSGSTNAGPHNSNVANKLDPRVDSDRDHRNDPTSTYGSNTSGGAYTQQTHSGSTNAGPHSSNVANKLDPRVDSDRDHRNDPTSTYGSNTSGGAYTGQTTTGSTNAGPHGSNLANKLDPRVDSDMDNRNDPTSRTGGYGRQENYGVSGANPTPSGNQGYGGQPGYGDQSNTGIGYGHQTTGTTTAGMASSGGHGVHGGHGTSTGTHGHSDIGAPGGQHTGYGTGPGHTEYGRQDNYGSSATPGSGRAQDTAGPHNSNMLNKLDPRVDSDADGSKTYGGNKTTY